TPPFPRDRDRRATRRVSACHGPPSATRPPGESATIQCSLGNSSNPEGATRNRSHDNNVTIQNVVNISKVVYVVMVAAPHRASTLRRACRRRRAGAPSAGLAGANGCAKAGRARSTDVRAGDRLAKHPAARYAEDIER